MGNPQNPADFSSADSNAGTVGNDPVALVCAPCRDSVRIQDLRGPRKVDVPNNGHTDATYRVTDVNKWFYGLSGLDGFTNWKVVNDFTGNTTIHNNKNHRFTHRFVAEDNGVLYKFHPYVKSPLEEVRQDTWVNKSYRRLIGAAVDGGNETVSDIFAYFCQFYVDRYERYAQYDDWRSTHNTDEMLEAIVDFLYKDKSRLDTLDFARKQKVVNHYGVAGSPQDAGDFDNEWDKVLHFLAGVHLSDAIGDWFGYEAGFWTEKGDNIKRVWGDITGTRKPHHVGFDWKDFAWTAAGSHFYELVADAPTQAQGINVIKAFASGTLSISSVFSANSIPAGHGFFNQRASPGFNTTIDLVDAELRAMKNTIEAVY